MSTHRRREVLEPPVFDPKARSPKAPPPDPNGGGKPCSHGVTWKSTKVWNEACFRCREMEGAHDRQTRQLGGRATKKARENGQKHEPQRFWVSDPETGVTWLEAAGVDRRFSGSRIQEAGGGGPSLNGSHYKAPPQARNVRRDIAAAERKDQEREWAVVRFLGEEAPVRLKALFSDVEWTSLMVRWPNGPYERTSDTGCSNALRVEKATFQENYQRAYAKAVRVRDYIQKAIPALLHQQNGGSAPLPYLQELRDEFQSDEVKERKQARERARKARKRGARRRPSVCGVAMRGKVACSRPPAHQGQHRSQ
jgi:hypothetical protein